MQNLPLKLLCLNINCCPEEELFAAGVNVTDVECTTESQTSFPPFHTSVLTEIVCNFEEKQERGWYFACLAVHRHFFLHFLRCLSNVSYLPLVFSCVPQPSASSFSFVYLASVLSLCLCWFICEAFKLFFFLYM